MLKKLKGALESRLGGIVLAIVAVQPALDVFSYFLGEMGSNTVSTLLRFGMPLCFGINKQYLDIPIGVLLVVVVVGRAVAGNPAVAAWLGRLRPKKKSKAGA